MAGRKDVIASVRGEGGSKLREYGDSVKWKCRTMVTDHK